MAVSATLVFISLSCSILLVTASNFRIDNETMSPGTPDALGMKVLRNLDTGEEATIIWESGGRTESLRLGSKTRPGQLRDVLAGHDGNASYVRENPHWAGCLLMPFANRIRNGTYQFQGTTYYLPRNEDEPGVRTDALHGFLCNQTLTVVSERVSTNSAILTLGFNFSGSESETPGWPFRLNVLIDYVLDETGFAITTSAFNPMIEEGQALPWFNSWHPYFLVTDVSQAVVQLDKCVRDPSQDAWNHVLMGPGAPRYGDLIPTGKTAPWRTFNGSAIGGDSEKPTYYDHEFKSTQSPEDCATLTHRIHDPVMKDTFVLWGDSQYRVVQVFTGARELWGWQAVAMEPMSALADAYNNHDGLTVLSAGQTFSGTFGVRIE